MVQPRIPLEERFWEKVQITPGCWLWLGAIGKRDGYGRIGEGGDRGRILLSHRVSFEIHNGPIPPDLEIDHVWPRCTRRSCPNPDHLEAVTPAENKRRQADRIERCPQGHLKTPENTYYRKSRNGRECRPCVLQRESDKRKKELT